MTTPRPGADPKGGEGEKGAPPKFLKKGFF